MSVFPCRLWLYVSPQSDRVVILRRGPREYSRLSVWDTQQDHFIHGQWLKANINTHNSDISSSADYFLYNVSYARREPYLWVALSRPPYFSALAMWPISDAWGGDSTFVSSQKLCIKPGMNQQGLELAEGFCLQNFVLVEGKYNSDWRWHRDGWRPLIPENYPSAWGKFFLTWEKADPSKQFILRRSYVKENVSRAGYGVGNAFVYEVVHAEKKIELEGVNCADWDYRGRILMATRSGTVTIGELSTGFKLITRQLLDFNEQSFSEIMPPPWASSW